MKNLFRFLSLSTLAVLTSSAAEQSACKVFKFADDIGTVSAIGYPTEDCAVVGTSWGCFRLNVNAQNPQCEFTNPHETFTIDAHKNNGLCAIANALGLYIYNATTNEIPWEKKDIKTKNMCIVFGKEGTILALDARQQLLRLLNYKDNTEQTFKIDCCKPEYTPTPLLSCYVDNATKEHIAYLNKNQLASAALVSDPITPNEIPNFLPNYTFESLYSPSGNEIAIADWTNVVTIWDQTEKCGYNIESILSSLSLAFHPNETLAILSNPGPQKYTLDFYNIKTGKQISQNDDLPIDLSQRANPMTYIRRLAFSPNKKFIAILGENNLVLIPVPQAVTDQTNNK